MNATPSPIRMKILFAAFGVIVALAALLGMLLGASGSEDEYPTGGIETVSDSQYEDSQYDESESTVRVDVDTETGGASQETGDSQYYDGGSIVRDDDGTIYYSDDNGNSISIGG